MTIFDHLFVLAFAVAQPVVGLISFRRLVRRIKAGTNADLVHIYTTTIATQWALFAVAIVIWAQMDRAWPTLGFGFEPDLWFLAGVVLTIAAVMFLATQLRQVRQISFGDLQQQLGDLQHILPRDDRELRRFYAVSMTAGVVEETLWRGFLIWYLAQFLPLWAAAVISTIAFGLAHAYQGVAHLPKVTLVGAIFAALYLLTGSLWLPMLLHAAVDMMQGRAIATSRKLADAPTAQAQESN